ncbi:MAG: UDP-N-acetylglucosamine 1-carboxyvinyltransferase, partial [Lachnospiraceae bacterium]|nr:UDP-N-acetylglucosamine 1-carboxyvinyltransferase [Lachnospiraceae bacterium]
MQYVMKGGIPLTGEVVVGGAKNAALGLLCAAIMTDENVIIDNLPDVRDINRLLDALVEIGARVERVNRHCVKICGKTIRTVRADSENVKRFRASYYLLGALLGKYGKAEVALPGGCDIGSRPIDQHLKGFRALGASTDIEYGVVTVASDSLTGGHVYLDVVSVGATINIMLAAV